MNKKLIQTISFPVHMFKLLLVNDGSEGNEKSIAFELEEILESNGFFCSVSIAFNPFSAIEYIESTSYDIIFSENNFHDFTLNDMVQIITSCGYSIPVVEYQRDLRIKDLVSQIQKSLSEFSCGKLKPKLAHEPPTLFMVKINSTSFIIIILFKQDYIWIY